VFFEVSGSLAGSANSKSPRAPGDYACSLAINFTLLSRTGQNSLMERP